MAIRETELSKGAKAILSSLGSLRAYPAATINLLLYELAAAIDLGLGRRAGDILDALQFFIRDFPELRQKVPEILRPADFLARPKDKRSELPQTAFRPEAYAHAHVPGL